MLQPSSSRSHGGAFSLQGTKSLQVGVVIQSLKEGAVGVAIGQLAFLSLGALSSDGMAAVLTGRAW